MAKQKDSQIVSDQSEFMDIVPESESWDLTYNDNDFLQLYDFNGVAFRAVDKYNGLLTKNNWTSNKEAFEKARKDINLDSELRLACQKAYVSGYALIYMQFTEEDASEAKLAEPVTKKSVPVKLTVVPKSWVNKDVDVDFDTTGKLTDCYVLNKKQGGTLEIHESRMIRVQFRTDKKSMLTPAVRALSVTDNMLWSVGQAFFRQAAGYTHLTVEKPRVIKSSTGVVQSEVQFLQEKGVIKKITNGTGFISDDRFKLEVKGIQGSKLSANEHWEISFQNAAMALQIPWQLLLGSNAGTVTGSETNLRDFYSDLSTTREVFIDDLLVEMSEAWGFSGTKFVYDSLFEETDVEKAEMVKTFSEAFSGAVQSGIVSAESALNVIVERTGLQLKLGQPQSAPLPGSNDKKGLTQKEKDFFFDGRLMDAMKDIEHRRNLNDAKVKAVIPPEKDLPPMESKVDSPKIVALLDEAAETQLVILSKNFKFTGLAKSLNGSLVLEDSEDDEDDAKRLIDANVDKFKAQSGDALTNDLDDMWGVGVVGALGEINRKALTNPDRMNQLKKAIKDNGFDLVVGASEDMRKDLKFQLSESLKNNTNANAVAKSLRQYVSTDFANKYKNRMVTIARQEMKTAFNGANLETYKDSGIVAGKQWIHSLQENPRPEHLAIHGEIVRIEDNFSIGCANAPCGVGCRCSISPIVQADMPEQLK